MEDTIDFKVKYRDLDENPPIYLNLTIFAHSGAKSGKPERRNGKPAWWRVCVGKRNLIFWVILVTYLQGRISNKNIGKKVGENGPHTWQPQ